MPSRNPESIAALPIARWNHNSPISSQRGACRPRAKAPLRVITQMGPFSRTNTPTRQTAIRSEAAKRLPAVATQLQQPSIINPPRRLKLRSATSNHLGVSFLLAETPAEVSSQRGPLKKRKKATAKATSNSTIPTTPKTLPHSKYEDNYPEVQAPRYQVEKQVRAHPVLSTSSSGKFWDGREAWLSCLNAWF